MPLWAELKRRKVFTAAAAYAVVAWLLVQIADVVLPAFELPSWILQGFLILIAVGFLATIFLAWIYEISVERESEADSEAGAFVSSAYRKVDFAIIGLLSVAVAYLLVNSYLRLPPEDAVDELSTPSLAVLAFANRSSDPEDAYFADGLADELLSVFARVRELKVASRTSSFYFKGKDVDITEIAAKLGVRNVLSGSVRREGDRIRITVALDETAGDVLLWSETYNRKIEDLLDIQSEIAQSVASAIVPVLSPESRLLVEARPTENTAAYDYYLRGRDFLRLPSHESSRSSAIELFDRAISLDPRFAEPYAGRCTAFLATYQFAKTTESFESAEAACHRALTLDDGSWEVRLALGNLYRTSGQYDKAIAEYEAGIAQQPNAASLLIGLARAYDGQNRLDLAETTFFRAEGLESGHWLIHNELGTFYGRQGRFEESVERFRRVIELTPDSSIGYDNLGNTFLSMGNLAEAKTAFEASPQPTRWTYENRGLVYYYLGEFDKAVEDQKKAVELAPENHRSRGNLGDAYRLSGDEDNAHQSYERAIELAEQALTINPDDSDTVARMGMYLAYTGQAERSTAEIQRVLDSDRSSVYYWAARVEMHHGDMETAYEYLRKVIDGGWSRALVAKDPDLVAHGGEEKYGRL